MVSGVYEIVNKVENKRYIGSTERDLRKRWLSHRGLLKRGCHHSYVLQEKWNYYGEDAFEFNVIHRVPHEYAKRLEQWYLDHYPGEYNVSRSTEGRANFKLSKEECFGIIDDYLTKEFTQRELSSKYKASEYTIGRVLSGRSYLKYKPDAFKIQKCIEIANSIKNGDNMRKLDMNAIGRLRFLIENGAPIKQTAVVFNVSTSQIHNYRKKEYYGTHPIIDHNLLNKIKKNNKVRSIVKFSSEGVEIGRFKNAKIAAKHANINYYRMLRYISENLNDTDGFNWQRI